MPFQRLRLDAAGILTQTYATDGQPDPAANTAGPLAGISGANTYDALVRRVSVSVSSLV